MLGNFAFSQTIGFSGLILQQDDKPPYFGIYRLITQIMQKQQFLILVHLILITSQHLGKKKKNISICIILLMS